MESAVFLDRDNTLIINDGDLGDPARVRLIEGVAAGLVRLREAGFRLIVVSNQGGVARGRFSEADVVAVNDRIAELVDQTAGRQNLIDEFYYCPFHPEGTVDAFRAEHPWRKPSPGMLLEAAEAFELDLAGSWLIGDQPRDIEAGRAAGCSTVLVSTDAELVNSADPSKAVESFAEAVEAIVSSVGARKQTL